jgi:hypothetical protein
MYIKQDSIPKIVVRKIIKYGNTSAADEDTPF